MLRYGANSIWLWCLVMLLNYPQAIKHVHIQIAYNWQYFVVYLFYYKMCRKGEISKITIIIPNNIIRKKICLCIPRPVTQFIAGNVIDGFSTNEMHRHHCAPFVIYVMQLHNTLTLTQLILNFQFSSAKTVL